VIRKKELPVKIIAKVGAALQELFGKIAEEASQTSGVIVRKRKFTGLSLARTFILGFLHNPEASDEELAQMAVSCGVAVTPQAIEHRHSPKLVKFLKELFGKATEVIVGSDKSLAPLLERFTSVIVQDSSSIALPDSLQDEYPGCGGSHGSGAAALKLQTEWDLRSGALTHVTVEPGRIPDGATSRQEARRGKGSLRITDLGYFSLTVFAAMMQAGEYFLSRLQFPTGVMLPDGEPVDLLKWLAEQPGPFVDRMVRLGKGKRLLCRLIAGGTSESAAAETASREPAQNRQRTHGRTLGLVRLDHLGDKRAGRNDDSGRSGDSVPRSLAGGVALQALENPRPRGGLERFHGGSANGGGLVAFVGGVGATLVGGGQRLGRSH
jgi:Transposase DDE domain